MSDTTDTLTLRMRARGAELVTHDVNRVNRSVRGTGDETRRSSSHVSIFSRALTVMQTRALIATTVVVALGVGVAALVPAMALVTAAGVALAGVLGPVFLIAAGAADLFGASVHQAGSAAFELKSVLDDVKDAMQIAVGPAAEIVLNALAAALKTLLPLIQSMQGPLTDFAGYIADALQTVADGLAGMGPQFSALLAAAGPLLSHLAAAIPPLLGALIQIAIAGMPVLSQIIDWLVDFARWLGPAVAWMTRFAHSAQAASVVHEVFHVVATVAKYLAGVIADLASITYHLYLNFKPLLKIVGQGVVGAFVVFGKALHFVSDNIDAVSVVLAILLANFVRLKILAAITALTEGFATAFWALDAAMTANPIGVVVVALAALAAAFVYAWQHSATFRNIVRTVWDVLKHSPIGFVISHLGDLVDFFKNIGGTLASAGSGMWDWMKDTFVNVLNFIIGKLNWLIRAVNDTAGRVPGVPNIDEIGKLGQGPGTKTVNIAGGGLSFGIGSVGGPVDSLGIGADLGHGEVDIRGGASRHRPVDHSRPAPRPDYYIGDKSLIGDLFGDIYTSATFVTPDGDVISKQVVKSAKKKKSTR